jgi:hypothetical protein
MVTTGSTRSWGGGSGKRRKALTKWGVSRKNKKFRNGDENEGPCRLRGGQGRQVQGASLTPEARSRAALPGDPSSGAAGVTEAAPGPGRRSGGEASSVSGCGRWASSWSVTATGPRRTRRAAVRGGCGIEFMRTGDRPYRVDLCGATLSSRLDLDVARFVAVTPCWTVGPAGTRPWLIVRRLRGAAGRRLSAEGSGANTPGMAYTSTIAGPVFAVAGWSVMGNEALKGSEGR